MRIGGVAGFASLIYVVKSAYLRLNEARRRHDTLACTRKAGRQEGLLTSKERVGDQQTASQDRGLDVINTRTKMTSSENCVKIKDKG